MIEADYESMKLINLEIVGFIFKTIFPDAITCVTGDLSCKLWLKHCLVDLLTAIRPSNVAEYLTVSDSLPKSDVRNLENV